MLMHTGPCGHAPHDGVCILVAGRGNAPRLLAYEANQKTSPLPPAKYLPLAPTKVMSVELNHDKRTHASHD